VTGPEHTPDTHDCGGDVAAYALGALDRAEAEAFREHLETCIVCRDELATFQRVVDILPMAAAQHPAPRRLRRRVLDAVEREPRAQLSGQPQARRRPRLAGFSVSQPAFVLGAVVAVVVFAVGGIVLGSSGTAKTRVYAAQVTGPGSAEVKVTGGQAELIVHHFSPPPAGQIYEVWLGRPNRPPAPTSALFSVTAKGDGDVGVPGNLHGVNRVLVTPEPAGGTRVPTHPAVILASLS
jgi:anti-sigma factor RsiW